MTTSDHETLVDEVGVALREMRESADRVDDALASCFGLNRSDLRCLALLYREDQLTAGQLADATSLSPGATTTALDRLERAGYALRVVDPHDRRRVFVRLTPAALELGARLYGQVDLAARAQLDPLGDADLVVVRDYLRGSQTLLDDLAARIRVTGEPESCFADDAHEFVAPLGAFERGRLQFVSGAGRVDLCVDPSLADLCRARFEGIVPEVSANEGTVRIRQRRRFRPFDWRTQATSIVLTSAVPWEISLRGGLWKFEADLTGLDLKSLDIVGGASDVSIVLPSPSGTVPVRVSGGASKLLLRRPAGTAAQASISGGASQLQFDGQRLGAVGGKTRLESDGYDAAVDRYDLRFSGGASKLVIERQ
ncbi:MAG: MarR family transcriptional regulator [Actinomycetota bacterium]|nr:MAG: MarR family transcriptional regulator [Actinomycetota bacterium]